MTPELLTLTDSNFIDATKGSKLPILLDFWADWCGPCKAVTPILEEIAKESVGKYLIGKINVEDNPDLAAKFRIRTLPTLVFLKHGEVIDQTVGNVGKTKILEILSTL